MHNRPPKKFVPTPFEYHEEIDLRIDSLTNLGAGVGRVDGWVVFVPYALPGELVRTRIFRNDKNHSQGDLVEILEKSPDRVEPGCPLFGECGGCQYQHLSYEKQLEWKTRQIRELLKHMSGEEREVNPCESTEQIWNYRSKITPHFEKPVDGVVKDIGFLKVGRRRDLLNIENCPIAMKEINEALPEVHADLRANGSQFRRGATILLRATQGRVERDPKAIAREEVGGVKFDFVAGEFFQNNPFILEKFTGYVGEQALAGGAKYLVDAYCGAGLFGLCLADRFERVMGVEVNEAGAKWAGNNVALNDLDNVSILQADAEEIFANIDTAPEETAVVIDPPRKGCTPEFLAQLVTFGPQRIVYVSCDPATQVRDYNILRESGYSLTEVQPFDLFPHTRHVENVMVLVKNG
ncbi:MAG: class I SAM-dependent RNA methyltransferase [Akkermansiaceae bacterium]